MRRFETLSLRTHLFLLVALLTLPALAGIIYTGYLQRRDFLEGSINETNRLVSVMASELRSVVASSQQLGSVIAHLPVTKEHDAAATNRILRDILSIYPQYNNLIITDRDGNVWASAIPLSAPVSIADRRHFRNARSSGRFSSGEYAIGRITKRPLLNFAYPRVDSRGEFDGVIGITFNLDFFKSLIQEARPLQGTAYVFLDHKGVIIYSSQNPGRVVGRDDREDLFRRMHVGPDAASFSEIGLDGQNQLISYRKLHLPGESTPHLYVRASTLTSENLAKARRLRRSRPTSRNEKASHHLSTINWGAEKLPLFIRSALGSTILGKHPERRAALARQPCGGSSRGHPRDLAGFRNLPGLIGNRRQIKKG